MRHAVVRAAPGGGGSLNSQLELTTRATRGSRTATDDASIPIRAPWLTDRTALLVLALVTLVAAAQLFLGGTLIGQDAATQFYPWYDYLGERLLDGELPGWNPYQFAGAPFAADPQSGWMYLPAMLFFTLFSLPLAVPLFIGFHLALAGASTYLLARLLGIGVAGSLVAAVAYELAAPVYGRSACCPAHLELGSWMPLALVGTELAMRTRDWSWRIIGWAASGLAVSQALGAWLGQGGYYFLLLLAAYIGYRALLAPADRREHWLIRLRNAVLHGGAILAIGFGLAAAGILPRLDYVARSNLAGGEYREDNAWASDIGGVTPGMIADRLFEPTLYYPGMAVLALAWVTVVLARGRYGSGFFLCAGIGALILATPWITPLHLLLYTMLPRFEELHGHWPDRVAIVSYLAFAILAGAAVESLRSRRFSARLALVLAGPPLLALFALAAFNTGTPVMPVAAAVLTLGVVVALLLPSLRPVWPAMPALLVAVVAADLLVSYNGVISKAPFGGFHRVDIEAYYQPGGAATFLRERMTEEPGRYVGFDDRHTAVADGQLVLYRYQFASDDTGAILVNNRGVLHGLEDAQGYNPVQPARFVDYLTALNGQSQEYHDANVLFGGFDSPLFDMLNIRYIVIPATDASDRTDLRELERAFPSIYADDEVRVLENPDALPRAWIVHQARQAEAGEILDLLATGAVDPRGTALLETTLLPLEGPASPASSTVTPITREPEMLRFETRTDAPGLLMLSETYDPNWRAYVDGEEVELHEANYLLRAVPIPAGDHIVELRYEPPPVAAGLAVSGLTAAIVFPALGWAAWHVRRTVLRHDTP